MDDMLQAVLMTAAVPGAVLGLLASFRSGIAWTLLGMVIGAIGGVAGGMAAPIVTGALGLQVPDGPATVAAGAVVGAFILLVVTSGLRRTA